jgi:hypothetical protein
MLAESSHQRTVFGARDLDATMLQGGLGSIKHGIVSAVHGAVAIA